MLTLDTNRERDDMTKPANFPERKRQRRLRALERLPAKFAKTGESTMAVAKTLLERTADNARDVRTKKFRG